MLLNWMIGIEENFWPEDIIAGIGWTQGHFRRPSLPLQVSDCIQWEMLLFISSDKKLVVFALQISCKRCFVLGPAIMVFT